MIAIKIVSLDPETSNYSRVLYAKDMDIMSLRIREWLQYRGVRKYSLKVLKFELKSNNDEEHKRH